MDIQKKKHAYIQYVALQSDILDVCIYSVLLEQVTVHIGDI